MATTGAFSGTNVFLRVLDTSTGGWVSIGGQLSHNETLNNALLDITNKIGSGGYRELLAGEGIQSVDYTVDLVFVSDAGFDLVRSMAGTQSIEKFQVLYDDVATGFVSIEVDLMVASFTETSDDLLKASVSLQSSDSFSQAADYTYELYIPSDADSYTTSAGDIYYVRA